MRTNKLYKETTKVMRLKTFLFLLCAGLFTVVNSKVDGFREIDIIGEFSDTGSRSVPVLAVQSDDAVVVIFSKAFGAIDATVSSETDVVYTTTLDVARPSQFSIYTGGYEPGVYLLELVNAANERVYGEFVVE